MMTTTHDVPMPEPNVAYFGNHYYTADQVRDTAIKCADARCAKLQEELAATEERSIRWSLTAQNLQAECDALAEKVKAINRCSATTQALIRMLIERDQLGRQKYGATLDRADLSPANWLQHMAEELLDGAGYALAAIRTAKGDALA